MRYIQHSVQDPPYQLQKTKSVNWHCFRAVSNSLEILQKGLCAYCQIRIDSSIGSHIEHIWPKSNHPEKTFQWDNLVLSCTHSEEIRATRLAGGVSCGHSNGKCKWPAYDPRFISPSEADCERYFEYRVSDGKVQPAHVLSQPEFERAEFTIKLLNLNCGRLCRMRKDILEEGYSIIQELKNDSVALAHFIDLELDEINKKLPSFFSARDQHFSVFKI